MLKEDIIYLLSLTRISGLNNNDIKKLLLHFEQPHRIFESDSREILSIIEPKKNGGAIAESLVRYKDFAWAEEEIKKCGEMCINLIGCHQREYPPGLKYIFDPPPVLYVLGDLKEEDSLSLAVVGTRRITNYGRQITEKLVRELCGYGLTIVSGMARGVDTYAHKTALESGGRTVAVLGSGIDITYPPENIHLKEKIIEQGAVISEFPLGMSPGKWTFPLRNRIIAGMTLGCLVMEAPEKSGALITARLSLEYGKDVFVVPGNITSSASAGCNLFLKQGAKPVTCIEDIIEEFEELGLKSESSPAQKEKILLSSDEKEILKSLGEEGAIPETIIIETGISPALVFSSLLQMELKGIIKKLPGGFYIKKI